MTGVLQSLIGGFGAAAAAVSDAYFYLVTLLLPGNGTNGAQNNTFLDSSSNNFTITRNGNTTQGTFSPFSQTGWSNYSAASSYVTSSSIGTTIGTADFCLEAWVYAPDTSPAACAFIVLNNSSGYNLFLQTSSSAARFLSFQNPNTGFEISGGTVSNNTWTHIVGTRQSGNNRLFVDGKLVAYSANDTRNYGTASTIQIAGSIAEYVSNARVILGNGNIPSAYQTSTTTLNTQVFTPPTTPLTAVTGTALLTAQDNRFKDNSTNNATFTITGSPSVQAFSPFNPTAAYDAAVVGGSGYFDGTGDYLSLPDNTAFSGIGSNDWTVEAWVYTGSSASQTIFTISGSSSAFAAIRLELSATANQMYLLCSLAGSAWDINYQAGTIPRNAWNHVAATRSGTSVRLYVNGAQVGVTQTLSGSLMSGTVNRVGIVSDNVSNPFNGYISNARYIRGTALYTGTTYTIPTAPFTAITNTQLLLNYTNAGITDATAKNDLETVGNAQISTTQSKFGGSSMYFDGTGDYLVVGNMSTNPNLALLAGDFTIEYWYYPLNTSIHATLNNLDDGAGNGSLWILMNGTFSGGSKVQFGYNTGGANGNILFGTGTFTANAWYHVAICRSGSNLRCFINGTQEGSTSTALGTGSIVAYNRNLVIGATLTGGSYTAYNLNGYLDDFRITRFARYTSNFTAPTAAFALQ